MIITCTLSPNLSTELGSFSSLTTSSCSVIPLFLPSMNYEAEDVNKHITNSDDCCLNCRTFQQLLNNVAHENPSPSNSGDKVNGEQLPPTNHWSLLLTLTTTPKFFLRLEWRSTSLLVNPGSLVWSSSRARIIMLLLAIIRKQCRLMSQMYSISLSRKREIAISLHLSERDVASGCILLQMTLLVPISSTQPMLWMFSQLSSCIGQLLKELLP